MTQSFKETIKKYIYYGKQILITLGVLKIKKNNEFNDLGSMIPNYCYHTI